MHIFYYHLVAETTPDSSLLSICVPSLLSFTISRTLLFFLLGPLGPPFFIGLFLSPDPESSLCSGSLQL